MKSVLLVLVFVALSLAFSEKEYQDSFLAFTRKYTKTYHHDEFQSRYKTFKQNLDFIESYNNRQTGVTLAVNQFADLTSAEFNRMKGLKKVDITPTVMDLHEPVNTGLPDSWDWTKKGAVTGIKNQQQCGSCWSFSTTGSTEGCHFISTGKLVSLSEQNLIDCSDSYGNEGCDGGLMVDAMEYIINNKGIDTESSYPYTAEDGKCTYNSKDSGATLSSYVDVTSGSESDLQAKAYEGPVSVAIDASQDSFQFYSSGVYYEPACSTSQLDHGVLVVGWGVSAGTDYWIVKNSWGTDWGINGYIWMSRNKQNNCGIATMATLPKC